MATGVAELTLDGVALDSNRLLLDATSPGTHQVRVRLGSVASEPRDSQPFTTDAERAGPRLAVK